MAISSLLLHPRQHLHILAATIFIRVLSVSTLAPSTRPEHNLLFVASYSPTSNLLSDGLDSPSIRGVLTLSSP